MRLSEFWALMEQEFGRGYAAVVARSHALDALGSRTAEEALDQGEPVRRVWEVVCRELEVPERHHYLPEPRRRD